MSQLPHADRIEKLLREGKVDEAKRLQTQHVHDEFERAERGEVINLSDLMAGREQFEIPRGKA